jgi:hypothetical protein
MKFIFQDASLQETRDGYLGMAYDMRMDRLSLQLFAIDGLIRLAPQKARVLWEAMRKPKLPPLKCEDALVFDVYSYYGALLEMAQKAFTSEELKTGEHIRFLGSNLVNIQSPAEVIPAAAAILDTKKINPTPVEFNSLVETYSRALENVTKDNRSFSFNSDDLSIIPLALASECLRRGTPADFLLVQFRAYLSAQLGAPRCVDTVSAATNPGGAMKYVSAFNDATDLFKYIPKITGEDVRLRKLGGAAMVFPYWQTPQAKSLFQKVNELRYGVISQLTTRAKQDKPPAPPAPLSLEIRRSSQWEYKLSDFLRAMAEWKPEQEPSKADYFHQKSYLYNNLIELSPNSSMRLKMIADYLALLERARYEQGSFIEWYHHVSDLMRRMRVMEREERELALNTLRDSNDNVLRLSAKLVSVFEAVAQAER